jgi:hypothetical protein
MWELATLHSMFGETLANSRRENFNFLGLGRYLRRHGGHDCRNESIGRGSKMGERFRLYRCCLRGGDYFNALRLGASEFLACIGCCVPTTYDGHFLRYARVSIRDEPGNSWYSDDLIRHGGGFGYWRFLVESIKEEVTWEHMNSCHRAFLKGTGASQNTCPQAKS